MFRDLVATLLETAVRITDRHASVASRRQEFLEELLQLIGADAGHWAWGRGHPYRNNIVPIAFIPSGYLPGQFEHLVRETISPEIMETLQTPMMKFMRPDGVVCAARSDLATDDAWRLHPFRRILTTIEKDSWIHATRYSANDTWSCLCVFRQTGKREFTGDQRDLIDLALCRVPWLGAATEEWLPSESMENLTTRQRSVLAMLLSGESRKAIAKKLHISEPTVNTHVAALFKHFGVDSALELAAQFLRRQ